MMNIRFFQEKDAHATQKVIEAAFAEQERNMIIELVADLSSEISHPPIQSFVAEVDHQLIGYVSYSPIFLKSNTDITGYILSPLAVSPNYQKKGVGSNLINKGKEILSNNSVDILLVYGDPKYYGRFGFKEEIARPFIPPYPLKYPFGWLGIMLCETDALSVSLEFKCVMSLNKKELW